MNPTVRFVLHVFTGPYMPADEFELLQGRANSRVKVERFTPDFLSFLAAADLSISMGGYNTCMNILASKVTALVWPYPGDREQGLRAKRMEEIGAITVLHEKDLQPRRLAAIIRNSMIAAKPVAHSINLRRCRRSNRSAGLQCVILTPKTEYGKKGRMNVSKDGHCKRDHFRCRAMPAQYRLIALRFYATVRKTAGNLKHEAEAI